MNVHIQFFSYFKELTGIDRLERTLPEGSTVGDLLDQLCGEFPALAQMRKATLIAVGVDYQRPHHLLKEGDQVSFFPPVQGG